VGELPAFAHRPYLVVTMEDLWPKFEHLLAGAGVYFVRQDRAMLAAIHRAGVDIRPEAMGVTWSDAAEAMRKLAWYVRHAGLWFTIADARPVTDDFIAHVKERVLSAFGPWEG
jgi:hypothetical protein